MQRRKDFRHAYIQERNALLAPLKPLSEAVLSRGSIKANSYLARSRAHIEHYGKFQIKVILILPAKTTVLVNINAPVYNANSLAFILL